MKTKEQGFTLIELMIVVAIIGVLASLAMSSYGNYIARAQAIEAVSLLSGLQSAAAEYYYVNGEMPTPAEIGAVTGGSYVELIINDNVNPTYIATFKTAANAKLAGKDLTLEFDIANQTYFWNCSQLPPEVHPKTCSN